MEQVRAPALVQATALANNKALHIILINSNLSNKLLQCPIPPVPSQNSQSTLIGSRMASVIHLAKLALTNSTVLEQQVQVLMRMLSARMFLGMALRALTLVAMVRLRVAMALLRLPSRTHSLAQPKASVPARLKAMALNRATAATANLPKAAMAQQLAATEMIKDRSEFYIQNKQQYDELNLS